METLLAGLVVAGMSKMAKLVKIDKFDKFVTVVWTLALTITTGLTVLGPGVLAPASPLVLERVEVRRVLNGWGLEEFASPDVARVAVDNCDLLGYHGVVVVEEMEVLPVYVVDCGQKEHKPLSARGLVADIAPQWGLGHREAVLILWKSPES